MSRTTRGLYNDPEYLNNIVNKKFGKLTVLSFDHFKEVKYKNNNKPIRQAYYKCKCDCGNIVFVERGSLIKGRTKSCGCILLKYVDHRGNLDDPEHLNEIVGKKYNMLTVIRFDHFEYQNCKDRKTPKRKPYYLCKCDCGNTSIVDKGSLVSLRRKSCGCINTTHGNTNDRIYEIWCGMKKRCYNPNSRAYADYGGRGIYICDEWLGPTTSEGFIKFRDWSYANGYNDNLTIDRIDNDGPYAPWNCRWVTLQDQTWNKRNNVLIYKNDKHSTIQNIINTTNTPLSSDELRYRFSDSFADNYNNWSENDKLFVPSGYGKEKYRDEHNIKDIFIFDNDSPYNKNRKE